MNIQPASLPTLYQISADFVMLAGAEARAYHIASGDKMGKEAFTQYCSKHYGDIALTNADGNLVTKDSGAIWWDWKDASKRVVRQIVMEPTSEPENLFSDVHNRWYVLKQEMAEADPGAQLTEIEILINHLMYISDGDVIGVAYFLNWLAQLWQTPGIKIPTGIMFYSRNGRVGKSLLAKLLGYVFGESLVKSCAGSVLHKSFNDAVEHKRIMVLNELARNDKVDNYETFKSLVSEGTMEFEGKGRASKEVKNFLHWIITTNNSDCLPLMDKDGRILVMRCEAERKDNAYYENLIDWIEGPGPELLAGCFAKWQFPADWDPYAPVPQTEACKVTQLESRSMVGGFVKELISTAKPPFDKDLGRVTGLIEQLGTLYPSNIKSLRLNSRTLPAALTELGHIQIPVTYTTTKGTKISTPVWCWRDKERWLNEPGQVVGDYLGD